MSFATASVTHWHALRRARGVTVTYTQQGIGTGSLVMVPAISEFDIDRPDGSTQTWYSTDWIILASELDIGSGAFIPGIGDRITYAGDNFEVSSPPGDARHYSWMDNCHKTLLRIFSKEIYTPAVSMEIAFSLETGDDFLLETGETLNLEV